MCPDEFTLDLKEHCECVKDATDEDVAELINMVSIATCWAQKPCETFLKSERREVIDLPSCADCPITFEPFYHPFDEDSFSFSLVKIEGIEETITPITEFAYHVSDEKFHIETGLPKCGCETCTCGCDPEYKLLVTYTAGYETVPECLLPVFCNLLTVIVAKNTCDCEDCGCENQEEQVKYATGDVVSVALETDLGKMLVEDYKKQLGMMSLCEPQEHFWGLVL